MDNLETRFKIVKHQPMRDDLVRTARISIQSFGNWTEVFVNVDGDGRAYNRMWTFHKFDFRNHREPGEKKYRALVATYRAKSNATETIKEEEE